MPFRFRRLGGLLFASVLAGCATAPAPDDLAAVDLLLLGEQHDEPAHQQRQREVVQTLAASGRLAALALEMADQGTSTAGLPGNADPERVRAALRWNDQAWPWAAYGPVVMAAVAAGVPVLGANLPRDRMRPAMADAALDDLLDPAALAAQREAIRAGHCDLMPVQQLAPMARIQVARDRAMAQTVAAAVRPGRTVVLVAGAGHVDPALGVPRHLPPSVSVRPMVLARAAPAGVDYCDRLRRQMGR